MIVNILKIFLPLALLALIGVPFYPDKNDAFIIIDNNATSFSLFSLILWYFTLQALSLSVLPFLAKAFSRYPDKAYGLSKTFGFFFFGLLSWLIPAYSGLPCNANTCTLLFFAFVLAGHFRSGGFGFYKNYFETQRRHVLAVESLFLGGLLIFTAIRWSNPEIFWGEKPMDSTLLLYFTRNETLPATDAWASGNVMRYYYLGSYLFASLLKLTGISPAIGYNLAIPSIPAFCLASLYTLFIALSRKVKFSIFGAICVIFLSNLEILNLVFIEGKSINFDTFWASTRLFTPPGFTEYPLWSYLFADLHAHVAAQIVCAMVLAMVPAFFTTRDNAQSKYQVLLLGICYASLMLLNAWDFIVYGLLIGITFFVKLLDGINSKNWTARIAFLTKEAAILAFVGAVITVPYMLTAKPSSGFSWGWNGVSEYNTLSQINRHFGAWIIISILSAVLILLRSKSDNRFGPISITFLSLISLSPIALGLASHSRGLTPPPWEILFMATLLILLPVFILTQSRGRSLLVKYCCIGLLTISLVIGTVEILFMIDRMNSVFKFYYSFWLVFSTASLAFSINLFKRVRRMSFLQKVYVLSARSVVIVLIVVCFVGGLINSWTAIAHKRTGGPRFTLNGQAYLENENSSEYSLIKWLNSSIKGNAVILEAHGDPYGPFTRIAMHTGLSTVLGWEHHVKQRGTPESQVLTRKRDIRSVYSTTDVKDAELILDSYNVDLIVVGELERKTYPPSGLEKFEKHPEIYPVLFKEGNTTLYTRAKVLQNKSDDAKLEIQWR